MARYHVKADGSMGVCTAKEDHCPFSGEAGTRHFTSKFEAQVYSEKVIKNQTATSKPSSLHKSKIEPTQPTVQNLSNHKPTIHIKLEENEFALPSEHFRLTDVDFATGYNDNNKVEISPGVMIQSKKIGFSTYPRYERYLHGSYINNSENKPVVYITGKFMKNGKFKTNATDSNTVLLFKDPGTQLNLGGAGDHVDDDVAEQTADFLKSDSPEAREMIEELLNNNSGVRNPKIMVIDDLKSFNIDWRANKT